MIFTISCTSSTEITSVSSESSWIDVSASNLFLLLFVVVTVVFFPVLACIPFCVHTEFISLSCVNFPQPFSVLFTNFTEPVALSITNITEPVSLFSTSLKQFTELTTNDFTDSTQLNTLIFMCPVPGPAHRAASALFPHRQDLHVPSTWTCTPGGWCLLSSPSGSSCAQYTGTAGGWCALPSPRVPQRFQRSTRFRLLHLLLTVDLHFFGSLHHPRRRQRLSIDIPTTCVQFYHVSSIVLGTLHPWTPLELRLCDCRTYHSSLHLSLCLCLCPSLDSPWQCVPSIRSCNTSCFSGFHPRPPSLRSSSLSLPLTWTSVRSPSS